MKTCLAPAPFQLQLFKLIPEQQVTSSLNVTGVQLYHLQLQVSIQRHTALFVLLRI